MAEDKDGLAAAYEDGYREAQHRADRELDYLRGQVAGLRNMNEALIKELSRVSSYLTVQPLVAPEDDLETATKAIKDKADAC